MILVLALAALIWGIAALLGIGRSGRVVALALLFAIVLAMQVLLPTDHPARAATGGSLQHWLLLAGCVALIGLYARGLAALKARASRGDEPHSDALRPTELRRYSRQIMLREIGGPGQVKLSQARVLVVGAGGLGAPVLLYLAAGGVGTIGIIDDDHVELSNLQRQIIHGDAWIGKPKVESARAAIAALNPHIRVITHCERFDDSRANLVAGYDLVIDGCDSFDTRAAVNRVCVAAGVPLISGAISQWEGQVSLFDPTDGGPCYACIFPNPPAPGLAPSCAEAGVLGPLPGVIGALMASESIKHLTGAGETLRGRMLIHDALYSETREMHLTSNPDCLVCGPKNTSDPNHSNTTA